MQVAFYRHGLRATHAKAVAQVLDSPFLTSGGIARSVEQQISAFFDVPHAKLTNSWTNGAVAALLAMNIGPGDEVIVPAMTFIASANVVELVGAKPVFVDVDPDTLLIDLTAARAAVSERTRAVIPVHLYGQMVDIGAVRTALGPEVAIIEDAAHCFEGDIRGDRPGRHSDAAIFSFYATKNITCGEGGAIITRSAELAEQIEKTVLHGMSSGAADRFQQGQYRHWDMTRLGTKANLPDILAALLPSQIDTVFDRLSERERLARHYETAIGRSNLVRFPAILEGARSARHLLAINVGAENRDAVMATLNSSGIGTTVNYHAVPTTTYYRDKYRFRPGMFPVAEEWGCGTLSLPLYPDLTDDEQEYVLDILLNRALPASLAMAGTRR
jgi:UDP-4-amino-4-deoxy-L-arabinose-oxoglutarate aminotransferase